MSWRAFAGPPRQNLQINYCLEKVTSGAFELSTLCSPVFPHLLPDSCDIPVDQHESLVLWMFSPFQPVLANFSSLATTCARCRLRQLIATRESARCRARVSSLSGPGSTPHGTFIRPFSAVRRQLTKLESRLDDASSLRDEGLYTLLKQLDEASNSFGLSNDGGLQAVKPLVEPPSSIDVDRDPASLSTPDEIVHRARQTFGDSPPDGLLNAEELRIWERLYGVPVSGRRGVADKGLDMEEEEGQGELDDAAIAAAHLLIERDDGRLEELEHDEDGIEDGEADEDQDLSPRELSRLERTKKGRYFIRATKAELDATILEPNLARADEVSLAETDAEWEALDDTAKLMYLDDVRYLKLERKYEGDGLVDDATDLVKYLFLRYQAQRTAEDRAKIANDVSQQPIGVDESSAIDGEDSLVRAHPLTVQNRFGTSPSTIQLPKDTFTNPISNLFAGTSPKHLSEAAHRILGGVGLPHSTGTPRIAKAKQQKPIPLAVSQSGMSDLEADTVFATLAPGMYASITSVMVETRKRLGKAWLEGLLTKDGGPRILDAGGAGVGVLAVREVLDADWQRMHEDNQDPDASLDVAPAGGRTGGAPIAAPKGKATVLTGSDTLRHRASALLEDTTFLPRLPDYVHASDPTAREKGKFDIIIAPHTLWQLKEDYLRKQHVANLWNMLTDGGVLFLIEKGVYQGFECIAGAREFLLDKRISSPGSETRDSELSNTEEINDDGVVPKDKGMIIAPCTNHLGCPMHKKGVNGRKDVCHFEQRYIRPPFMQQVLGAKDKNHEDVKFSYLSVMRGRDLRDERRILQGDRATDRAFTGYEDEAASDDVQVDPTAPAVPHIEDVYNPDSEVSAPHSLSLPRSILPPLKRTGHVIMDLCTPSGTLERWTVPRSFSKQAFRDARKSSWGDLWALGAKTRINKSARQGQGKQKQNDVDARGVITVKGKRKDPGSRTATASGGKSGDAVSITSGGRVREGKKVKGIRDKRDKKGMGNGRRPIIVD